ncbi:MAG: hypothetical protein JXB35_13125, partial [Anaerolineae bacterium]|nr:hypothetical protein [Anaerolineae bacterium]
SPAFTITADDVTILGPGVIDGDPTDSGTNSTDPGILVQAGADNFILQNVEVKRWADGARVDGNVTSLKIVGSWFHSNTDAGLEVNGDIAGITTIEGNLFKVNGGNGVTYAGAGLLKAEYNAWGDLGGPNAGSGDGVDPGTVDFEPFTFAEFFIDVDPDLEATEREVPEGTDFDVELKADTANLFGLTFKIVYDTSWLTLNSTIFSAPWVNRCAAIPPTTAGEIYYYCNLRAGDGEWTVDGDTVATLNFTTAAGTTGENGPWETTLDISHAILDTSAGARNGAKIYVNNAGFNDPSASERDITDTDDGKITILGQAQYTGYVDLQGRANDSGALVSVFDSNARSTAVLLADATSASSGTYTTAYVGATPLTIGSTYWLLVDRALYLPTTLASADYGDSKLLDTRPLTLLATLILLGGDATNDDTIDIYDLSCIGGDYGMTSGFTECGGAGSGGSSDVNGDSLINIQDLSLSGGNWYLSESPWTP